MKQAGTSTRVFDAFQEQPAGLPAECAGFFRKIWCCLV
jgi:hypothetical protein